MRLKALKSNLLETLFFKKESSGKFLSPLLDFKF